MERVLDRKPMVSMPAEVSYSFPGRKSFALILFKGTDSQSLYQMTIEWLPPRHEELLLIYE